MCIRDRSKSPDDSTSPSGTLLADLLDRQRESHEAIKREMERERRREELHKQLAAVLPLLIERVQTSRAQTRRVGKSEWMLVIAVAMAILLLLALLLHGRV